MILWLDSNFVSPLISMVMRSCFASASRFCCHYDERLSAMGDQ